MSLKELQDLEAAFQLAISDEKRDIVVNMTDQTITLTRKDYLDLMAKLGHVRNSFAQALQIVRENRKFLQTLGDDNKVFAMGEEYGAMRERAELCAYMEEAIASVENELVRERSTGSTGNSLKVIHFERLILVFQSMFKLLMEHKFYPLNRKIINMPRWHTGQAFPDFPRLDRGGRDGNTHTVGKKLPTANEISESIFGSARDYDG